MRLIVFILLAFIVLPGAMSDDSQVSEGSVKELMAVLQTHKLVDEAYSQMDAAMQSSMQHVILGRKMSPEQQKIMDDMRAKIIALFKDNMKWDTLEPTLCDLYRRTFTQQEVDGMLSFYKSPSGQAVIAKMPLVMQNTMQLVQTLMTSLMPKIQQIQRDTIAQLKASEQK
jgi:hypothetical protein